MLRVFLLGQSLVLFNSRTTALSVPHSMYTYLIAVGYCVRASVCMCVIRSCGSAAE